MSGAVTLCWRCGENTWAGRPCECCGAPEEPPEYPETFSCQELEVGNRDGVTCRCEPEVSECCGAPFVSETDFCSRCHDHAGNAVPVCAECGQERPDDDRVLAGMKCGPCAYGC